jgi:hypothetical protein
MLVNISPIEFKAVLTIFLELDLVGTKASLTAIPAAPIIRPATTPAAITVIVEVFIFFKSLSTVFEERVLFSFSFDKTSLRYAADPH